MQFGRDGITVNCIHPDTTRTEHDARRLAKRAVKESIAPEELERREYVPGAATTAANNSAPIAIGRILESSEVADVAVFLASEPASAVTDELLSPNGGYSDAVFYQHE